MSYEYKKSIKRDLEILNQLREVTDWRVGKEIGEKQMELDYIYAQAAKADEYEAKAKAWDKYKAHMERHIDGEINEEELVSDLKSDYFESGEQDA